MKVKEVTGNELTANETTYKTIHDVEHEYMLVDSPDKEVILINKLSSCTSFTFDTETAATETGSALSIYSLQLVGISFAFTVGEAFYVSVPEDPALADQVLQPYKVFFENPAILKIGHNLKFDINVMRRYGIVVRGNLFDTMIAHYLYDANSLHGLKELSRNLLGYQQIEIENLIGTGKHQISMRDIEPMEVSAYANEDTDQTLQLYNKLNPLLKEQNVDTLFTDVEIPLIQVLADMEYEGVKLDSDTLYIIEQDAREELESLKTQIYEIVGTEFNISSNIDLAIALYEELGLEPPVKTKTGTNSVGKKALKKLEHAHPVIPLLIRYKAALSILNNFLTKLPYYIHPITERVHTNFKQDRAVTGRLASSNPNLQNIPNNDGFGKLVRKAFVPRDENHVIVSADYSQIELRIVASISKDPVMVTAFKNDEDIHLATATKVFNVEPTEVTNNQRKIAKTINFGLNYLMSAKSLAERISEATGETIEVSEAQSYVDKYFDEFSGVKKYQEEAYMSATLLGYSTTLFGRRRYIPDIDSAITSKRMAAKRLAVNTPIQGTSADIIKMAMVQLHKELLENNFKSKIILQIHDELVFDVPKNELEVVLPLIKKVMEGVVKLEVPLRVDIGHGYNWLEAH